MVNILVSPFFWLSLGMSCAMVVVALWFDLRLRRLSIGPLPEADRETAPPAVVIMPFKGIDPGLRDNLLSVLRQDHPDLRFVFAVESESDPAYRFIDNLLAGERQNNPALRAKLVVAEKAPGRAQKISNQLAALKEIGAKEIGAKEVGAGIEHLVFLDSDARLKPSYVRALVAGLDDEKVGATTGYRWYQPAQPGFGALLCSTWNAGAFLPIAHPKLSWAWGGAMAVRRQTFIDARVEEAWAHAVSDDLALTLALRRHGLDIRYVPECVAITHESPTLAETAEFTSRQMLILKVYFPIVWQIMSVVHPALVAVLAIGLANALGLLAGAPFASLAGLSGLLLLPAYAASALLMIKTGSRWMSEVATSLQKRWFYYVLLGPLASLLSAINSARNILSRKIVWRGIQYELVSPQKTIVTRP